MALKVKSKAKTSTKSLKDQIHANTTVTKGTKKESEVLKEGIPCDSPMKQKNANTVGVNIGVTKNMDNYESLRVDCWCCDTVQPDETQEEAFERVTELVDRVLQDTVSSYIE